MPTPSSVESGVGAGADLVSVIEAGSGQKEASGGSWAVRGRRTNGGQWRG